MTAPVDSYTVASGQPIYGGMAAPSLVQTFDSVTSTDTHNGTPWSPSQYSLPFGIELHGSGGASLTVGTQYRAAVSSSMAFTGTSPNFAGLDYDSRHVFGYSVSLNYTSDKILMRPIDRFVSDAGVAKEGYHFGLLAADGRLHLINERRYDAMIDWAKQNLSMYAFSRLFLAGGSMGGWGSASYGIRRGKWFASIYPDRPRWNCTNVSIPVFDGSTLSNTYTQATAPLLAPEDGGGNAFDYLNCVAYASNTANKLPWVGWCAGRHDGYAGAFTDQIAMMDAMLAAKRGFAFYWNDGGHEAGSSLDKIIASYPYGLFDLNKGYPLFTNFSRDQDPRVHIAGGINLGLSFRNVVETTTGWSCEITCVTPTTITGTLAGSISTTQVQLPITESEIPNVYVGGTIAIGSDTRTISAYTPVGIDQNAGAFDNKTLATVTVSTPFSSLPASNASYTIVRPDQSCTVKVEPISSVFTKSVAKQTITIPAANTWVPVSFT